MYDLVSDCHIDHHNEKSLPWKEIKHDESNVLVVAGDHSNKIEVTVNDLITAKLYYDFVIFVDGNHEWYKKKLYPNDTLYVKELCEDNGIIYLNGNSFIIEDTAFIGASGWYDFRACGDSYKVLSHDAWKKGSNDSKYVFNKYSPNCYSPEKLALEHALMLEKEVKAITMDDRINNIVMVSHTSPLKNFVGIKQPNDVSIDFLDGAYANITMGDFVLAADVKSKIKHWCFGHTHKFVDQTVDGVRYLNNSRGYPSEVRHDWCPLQLDIKEKHPFDV